MTLINQQKKENTKLIPLEQLITIGIDSLIIDSLKRDGIEYLYEFQYKAIQTGIRGKSLLIVAPTGSGKTLIGEVIAAQKALKSSKKVFYLTPYKALSEEIKNTFSRRYPYLNIGIATGDYTDVPLQRLASKQLIVLTYEKADHIFRERPSWLGELGLVIVDEIHMLGDPSRGPVLDIVLTYSKLSKFQIIGLSATVPNPEDISLWLNATLIISNHRPIKLLECVYYTPSNTIIIYDPAPERPEEYLVPKIQHPKNSINDIKSLDQFINTDPIKSLIKSEKIKNIKPIESGHLVKIRRKFSRDSKCRNILRRLLDKDLESFFCRQVLTTKNTRATSFIKALQTLIEDTLIEMKRYNQFWQILIFRNSRSLAQKTARRLAEHLEKILNKHTIPDNSNVLEALDKIPAEENIKSELKYLLARGVAFHHAGLSRELRELIEQAFREKLIFVLVATPTLAAGVNLPARRVIVDIRYYNKELGISDYISNSEYKQRAGRAGRPGFDSVGESFVIAHNLSQARDLIMKYILGDLDPVRPLSGFVTQNVYSQVLSIVILNPGSKINDILEFYDNTFFGYYLDKTNDTQAKLVLSNNIVDGIHFLMGIGAIKQHDSGYYPTRLGVKINSLYLKPTSAKPLIDLLIYWKHKNIADLDKQRVDEALYTISQSSETFTILRRLLAKYGELSEFVDKHLDSLDLSDEVGLDNYYLEDETLASIAGAILLRKWIDGEDIPPLLTNFIPNFGMGDFNEFLRVATWLAYCIKELAPIFELPLSTITSLDVLTRRLRWGLPIGLLELAENVEGVGRVRAISLLRAGFKDINDLANATTKDLIKIEGIGPILAERIISYARSKLRKI